MGLLAAAAVSAALLGSAATGAERTELTLEQALAIARERGVPLAIAASRVKEARARRGEATRLVRENPELSTEMGPRRSPGGSSLDWSVGLSQPLELPGRRGARVDGAEAEVRREDAALADARRTFLSDVARQFARALFARERLALVKRNHEVAAALLQTTQRRREAGDVSLLELNVSKAAEARARAQILGAEGEERSAAAALADLLALPSGAEVIATGRLPEIGVAAGDPKRGIDRADVAALRADLAAAEAERRLGAAEAWPDLALGAQYGTEGPDSIVQGTLSLSLPVFARGQQTRQVASARIARLEVELEAALRRVERSVAAARLRSERAAAAVAILESDAVPLAVQSEGLAQKGYSAGELSLAELLVVRRESLESRAQFLELQLDAALARIELAEQMGVVP